MSSQAVSSRILFTSATFVVVISRVASLVSSVHLQWMANVDSDIVDL